MDGVVGGVNGEEVLKGTRWLLLNSPMKRDEASAGSSEPEPPDSGSLSTWPTP